MSNVKQSSIAGSVARMGIVGTLGVGSAMIPSLVGKATVRAASIRYSTKVVGVLSRGIVPSNTWRAAAVFTGTRVSNYINSGWIPYAMFGLLVYDVYKVGKYLMSDS